MYHEFFGLKEPAFSIAVNPRYLYMSAQHREALAHLLYGIQNGGFVMLTGEVGTGKTTIIRCLLEQLPDNTDMAIILNPMASAPELLSTICDELGVSYINDELSVKELTDSLNHFLLENHRKGRKTVLLIDEAQLLKVPVLEQIRLLTNLETTTEKLLQIILVGQPELKKLLARPALRQLSQRITARFHLEALSLEETQAYIAHRLSVAGMHPGLVPFTPAMIRKIHDFSGGIPRLINVLCERLMLGAYAKNLHQIDDEVFKLAVLEVSGTNNQEDTPVVILTGKNRFHAAFVVSLLVVMMLVWLFVPDTLESQIATTSTVVTTSSATDISSLAATSSIPGLVLAQGSVATRATAEVEEKITEPLTPDLFDKALRDFTAAQRVLMKFVGAPEPSSANPCSNRAEQQFMCEKQTLRSWDELKDINRPALLTLVTPEKKWVYLLMVGLGENRVLVRHEGQDVEVSWDEVANIWNGDVLYVWSRPLEFQGAIQQGDKGDLVTWVAEQFARLDQQSSPLARQYYTDKLKTRVELFQSSNKIVPNGIFDAQTLRRLNEALGVDKTLVDLDKQGTTAPGKPAVGGR